MRIIDNKINLEASFKELLSEFIFSRQFDSKVQVVRLRRAIRKHIKECTATENVSVTNANDIPKDLFQQ